MSNLSIVEIMTIIYNFIKSHNIEDHELRTKLYASCMGIDINKRDIIIILNEVYIYYRLKQKYIYKDGLNDEDKDNIVKYNPNLPIIRLYVFNLLKILSPYERTVIILEFYDKLSLKEISIELDDTIEHITTIKQNALERLKNNIGDLIDYLPII